MGLLDDELNNAVDKKKEEIRERVISDIYDGDLVRLVEVDAYTKAGGHRTLDDIYDEEGDAVYARPRDAFWWGVPEVRLSFVQGTDPLLIARFLKKIVPMLEGEWGRDFVNLGLLEGPGDHSRRLADGDVGFGNYQRFLEEHDRAMEESRKTAVNEDNPSP